MVGHFCCILSFSHLLALDAHFVTVSAHGSLASAAYGWHEPQHFAANLDLPHFFTFALAHFVAFLLPALSEHVVPAGDAGGAPALPVGGGAGTEATRLKLQAM